MSSTISRPRPRFLLLRYGAALCLLWAAWAFVPPPGTAGLAGELSFLAFIALCTACFLMAAYHFADWLIYGDAQLDLIEPAFPGGRLVSILRLPGARARMRRLSATFRCKEAFVAGTAKGGRHLFERVLWSITAAFPVVARGRDSECRIAFDVPADALLTTGWDDMLGRRTPGCYWELVVRARVPGVDFRRSFLVKVGPPPQARVASP